MRQLTASEQRKISGGSDSSHVDPSPLLISRVSGVRGARGAGGRLWEPLFPRHVEATLEGICAGGGSVYATAHRAFARRGCVCGTCR